MAEEPERWEVDTCWLVACKYNDSGESVKGAKDTPCKRRLDCQIRQNKNQCKETPPEGEMVKEPAEIFREKFTLSLGI